METSPAEAHSQQLPPVLLLLLPVCGCPQRLEAGSCHTTFSRPGTITPAGSPRLVCSYWEVLTLALASLRNCSHLTPPHLTALHLTMIHRECQVLYCQAEHLCLLYCSDACTIHLKDSVIITGGGQWSGAETLEMVQQYNLAGPMGRLPDLRTGRFFHACGQYVLNGEAVSINLESIVTIE